MRGEEKMETATATKTEMTITSPPITEQSEEIRRTVSRKNKTKRKPRKEFYVLQNTQQQLDPQVGNS